ncbi:MAG: zf-HC2 domain-containing protein, partial [Gemmatimonadales bacterium]|nr:zf-HC2 domain-containing protein [Gemmatimonadales bacterium]
MSHVSEGILHAYLDGALDQLPGGEADSVRDHLARCTQCSIQLGEAGAVRDEAIAILGGILPPLDMPPLEDLRS